MQEILPEVEKLLHIKLESTTEDLSAQLEKVHQLSQSLGLNRIFPEHNNGTFKGYTLDGRIADLTKDKSLKLGQLSFNIFQPNDTKLLLQSSELSQIFKGDLEDQKDVYSVSTAFTVEGSELKGLFTVYGTYKESTAAPGRLEVDFYGLKLEPVLHDDASIRQWVEQFGPHNPNMDERGVAFVHMPKAPHGHLDYWLMTHDYQITKGNFGSAVLHKRVS